MTKYKPLQWYLHKMEEPEWKASFAEIEDILGFSLPPSARLHRAWWANTDNKRTYATSWLKEGWRVAAVDFSSQHVVFNRQDTVVLPVKSRRVNDIPVTMQNGNGLTPHAWDDSRSLECKLGMRWQPLGRVIWENGELQFPGVARAPGIYRLRIRQGDAESLYIGETQNLFRRFGHYRRPGPRQKTSIRIHAELRKALTDGAEVSVAVVTSGAWLNYTGVIIPADFFSKAVRCLFENAALVEERAEDIEVLNKAHVSKHVS